MSYHIPPVSETSQFLPQLKTILDTQVIQRGRYRLKTEMLVKWVGIPVKDATLGELLAFLKDVPQFRPCGQGCFKRWRVISTVNESC